METFDALIDVNEVQTVVIDQVAPWLLRPGPFAFGKSETSQLLRALLALKRRRPTSFSRAVATQLVCDCPCAWMVIIFISEFSIVASVDGFSFPVTVTLG